MFRTRLAALESWEAKIENQMEELKKDHKSDEEFKKKKEKFEADTSVAELDKIQEEMAWLKMTAGRSERGREREREREREGEGKRVRRGRRTEWCGLGVNNSRKCGLG